MQQQQQLPKTFTLQTNNNKYLSYVAIYKDENDLRLVTEDVYSYPNSIFETEASSVEDGLFVSIKSSYNNKYLEVVSKSENDDDDDQHLVSPTADTPNEDESNESCTLFKPYFDGENDKKSQVRFYHAHYKTYLCFSETNSGLFLPSPSEDKDKLLDWFTFADIEPPFDNHHVYAFEGDNKKFLSIFIAEEYEYEYEMNKLLYLKFFAEDLQSSPDIWFKCQHGKDNKLLEIKSITKNGCWSCGSSKWVVVDGAPDHQNPTQFKFDSEKSAFMVNGNYCQRNIISNKFGIEKVDCLIANTPIPTEQAKLKVHRKPREDDMIQITQNDLLLII